MHLLATVSMVLGAWLIVAVPAAVVVGRFLRFGNGRAQAPARAISDDSFGSPA